jgi:uronate dehydrogenase
VVQTKPPAEDSPSGGAPPGRLLLTGAAGTLGRQLMPFLATLGRPLRVSDLPGPLAATPLPDGAEPWPCDLADGPGVHAMLAGVQAVVHLGGVSVERPFLPILRANIVGVQHLYDAARRQGTRRVVFASSNHVTGCYGVDEVIGPDHPPCPDGHYGVSKMFGEGVAAMHWHRYGIESVCLRIGTAEPQPPDRRALASWISPRDLQQLVRCALEAPGVGCLVTYGCSRNTRAWWRCDDSWARLGYAPQDDAEAHAAAVQDLWLPEGPQREMQGGRFLAIGPFDT